MSWEKVSLDKICTMLSGNAWAASKFKDEGDIPIIRIQNLGNNENEKFIWWDEPYDKKFIVTKGEILLSLSGSIKVDIWNGVDALLNQRIVKLIPKKNIDQKWFFWQMTNIILDIERMGKWALVNNVSITDLKNLEIPLPPLTTQKRIAEILDAADALRRKDQELLKKYDELAQAIFIDMFGDPVKNEKGWEVKRIGEISKIKGGKRLPPGDKLVKYNTGLPYIKAGNIKSGKVNLSDLEYLLPETQRKIINYTVKAGDVCITIVGVNIGDVGIVPKELDGANLTENAAKIIVNDSRKLNNVYLSNFWRMPFIQNEIKKRAMAVGVPKLALFRIEEIEIIIPPYSDQIKFNSAIEIINEHSNMSFQNQIYSTNIFDSLIQKAFNGELVE